MTLMEVGVHLSENDGKFVNEVTVGGRLRDDPNYGREAD